MKRLLLLLVLTHSLYGATLNSWNKQDLGVPAQISSIAFGNGVFVAGGNVIVLSTNGVDWSTAGQDSLGGISNVEWSDGIFVAMQTHGDTASGTNVILVSEDGKAWTEALARAYGSPRYDRITDIAFGSGLWVAVTWDGNILTSEDGRRWLDSPSKTTLPAGQSRITFGGSLWVASSDSADFLALSTDLTTWATIDVNLAPSRLAYENGVFVCYGERKVISSVDGRNWTPRITLRHDEFFHSLSSGGGVFLLMHTGSTVGFLLSTNGASWRNSLSIMQAVEGLSWRPSDIAFGNDRFVLVGSGNDAGVALATDSPPVEPFHLKPMLATANGIFGVVAGIKGINVGYTRTNKPIVVEASTNFTDWRIVAIVTPTNGTANFTDPTPTPARRFYRALIP